ncbi:hypothetical protein P168DRAFT_180917 [Aspergillus campestris IBT 28561]|uniref:Uncharacterized protein n=1 Tax=Aspergillus campestris (strain IBT 28561) TaxID=1392248 RepID=A0A2I1D0A6_ASPC2|nr:uncharacterized protein P168DRAFT_180917 [Aspergillus campestris IBT 28561]PKY03289.1 hypothetical protein P168DRAFT_180917 [Aspergillus campestris IBT 28561]
MSISYVLLCYLKSRAVLYSILYRLVCQRCTIFNLGRQVEWLSYPFLFYWFFILILAFLIEAFFLFYHCSLLVLLVMARIWSAISLSSALFSPFLTFFFFFIPWDTNTNTNTDQHQSVHI